MVERTQSPGGGLPRLIIRPGARGWSPSRAPLDLITGSEAPVSEIVGEIRTSLLAEADAVRGREGATQFIDGLCARLRELTQNRIRSTPDARERDRLREFLRELDRLCREARERATTPP